VAGGAINIERGDLLHHRAKLPVGTDWDLSRQLAKLPTWHGQGHVVSSVINAPDFCCSELSTMKISFFSQLLT
jgi:hypothetical protein